jgi:hypothetical protein
MIKSEEDWTLSDCSYGLQYCHICPEIECGDNSTPAGKIVRKLHTERIRLQEENHEMLSLLKRLMEGNWLREYKNLPTEVRYLDDCWSTNVSLEFFEEVQKYVSGK